MSIPWAVGQWRTADDVLAAMVVSVKNGKPRVLLYPLKEVWCDRDPITCTSRYAFDPEAKPIHAKPVLVRPSKQHGWSALLPTDRGEKRRVYVDATALFDKAAIVTHVSYFQ